MPIKIGVSFPVLGQTVEECLRINQHIRSLAQSQVTFGDNGNSSPHVTIAMGTVADDTHVQAVIDRVESLVRQLPEHDYMNFELPYRETVTTHYVFADVVFSHPINQWRLEARHALDQFFAEPARTSDVPHLTLGHVSDNYVAVDEYLLKVQPLPRCEISWVEIALSGPKGVKGEVLWKAQV